jgi:hypothetical protein
LRGIVEGGFEAHRQAFTYRAIKLPDLSTASVNVIANQLQQRDSQLCASG